MIEDIRHTLLAGANPMDFKKFMAFEIVKEIKGEESAKKAQEYFERTVQNKEIPDDIPTFSFPQSSKTLIEILVQTGLVTSNSEARRLIEQGGVKVDGNIVLDTHLSLHLSSEVLIQKGKRSFVKIQKGV